MFAVGIGDFEERERKIGRVVVDTTLP